MLQTGLIICFLACVSHVSSTILKTSGQPVILNVKKGNQRSCTSKPIFFQRVLGLEPGSVFNFDMVKWKELVFSGLYANLTAHSSLSPDGVMLNISGVELPTTYFTPEVSIVASLDNPEFMGGVRTSLVFFVLFVMCITTAFLPGNMEEY